MLSMDDDVPLKFYHLRTFAHTSWLHAPRVYNAT